jgi:hypothetical protein
LFDKGGDENNCDKKVTKSHPDGKVLQRQLELISKKLMAANMK